VTLGRSLAALVALCATAVVHAGSYELAQTVLDPTPATSDFFACAVAPLGDDLIVGARFDDAAAVDAGVAYLIDGASGQVRMTYTNPSPSIGAQFGASVTSLGSWVAVGAPHAATSGPHAGAVYLFDAASGANLRTFTNPSPEAGQLFGSSLGAAGLGLLAGTPLYDGQAPGSGAMYLFDGASGELVRAFRNPNPDDYDLFGQALAGVGSNVVIGAPFDDTAAANGGAVYIFDPAQRSPIATFTSPHARAGDFFGSALATSGSWVFVGAPFDDSAGPDAGAVYMFDANTGALLRMFSDPAVNVDGRFGSAVAVRGDRLLVGAPFADTTAQDAGMAYLFDAGSGALLETFENPTPSAGDQFGGALAVLGGRVAIGSWLDDTAAPDAGALYIYRDVSLPTTTTTSSTTTTGPPTTVATTTTSTAPNLPGDTTTTTGTISITTTSTATTTTDAGGGTTTSTTSTTLPDTPNEPPGCADDDPCTVDATATAGTCTHTTPTGLQGSMCRLQMLDAALHASPAKALGGKRMLARLRHKVSASRRLVTAAYYEGGPRAGRRVRRARRALGRFAAAIDKGERRGSILPVLASRLSFLAGQAGEGLVGGS
jgi:FG-GAP repeat